MPPEQQQVNLDLDGLVARYGRRLAQAELEAEIASQRADRLEATVAEMADRLAELEADGGQDSTP